MCGRYAIYTEEENLEMREIIREINDRYINASEQMKTGEIFPTNTIPAVISDESGGHRAALLKWGFENKHFSKGIIINARSESIFEKPTFKSIITVNRCLLPASCFFEWKADTSGRKLKYAIRPAGVSCFYMAGIFDSGTFVIITTDASPQMLTVHNRMPVIFNSRNDALEWISPSHNKIEIIQSRMIPYKGSLSITAA